MIHARHQGGYTVLELLTTCTILALLLGLALPALATLERSQRARSLNHSLVAGLNFARISALQRGEEVRLCPSRDAQTCAPAMEWVEAFVVYADLNRNGRQDPDEPLLRTVQYEGERIRLASSSGRLQIRFRPDGSAYGSNATLLLCDRRGESAGAVIISNTGRIRSERRASPVPEERCRRAS